MEVTVQRARWALAPRKNSLNDAGNNGERNDLVIAKICSKKIYYINTLLKKAKK